MTKVSEVAEKQILEKMEMIRELSEKIERAEDMGVTAATLTEKRRALQAEVVALQKFLQNWKDRQ